MGISIAAEKDYYNSIRDLFPKGEYWEKQFSDPQSDINLFCKVKIKEIICLRKRMNDLLAESNNNSAVETISDWERVLIGHMNIQLSLSERREKLKKQKTPLINRLAISEIAKDYGLKFIDIIFPFQPSFFGFSKFGQSVFSCPAFFSVYFIIIDLQDDELKNKAKKRVANFLETYPIEQSYPGYYEGRFFSGIKVFDNFEFAINSRLLSGNIVYFQYKLEE